ncbi:MAG: Hint domain-containing protein [Pseudomonadota bacterium]
MNFKNVFFAIVLATVLIFVNAYSLVINTSCFHPDSKIMVRNNENDQIRFLKAGDLFDEMASFSIFVPVFGTDEFSLKESAILEKYQSQAFTVKSIVNIELDNGKKIMLTKKHPLLLFNGDIVLVEDLNLSDELFGYDGRVVRIKQINSFAYNGVVYNFTVESKDHFFIVEGIVVGDLYLQENI